MTHNQLPVVDLDQVVDPEDFREAAVQAVFGISLGELLNRAEDESDPS